MPKKFPRKRKIGVNGLVLFQAVNKIVDTESIFQQNSPENFNSRRLDNKFKI